VRRVSAKFVIRRTACARAQFCGCSSTTNAHSETGQMAVCCQNLALGALSSRSVLSLLVGALFKKLGLFFIFLYFTKCSYYKHVLLFQVSSCRPFTVGACKLPAINYCVVQHRHSVQYLSHPYVITKGTERISASPSIRFPVFLFSPTAILFTRSLTFVTT
jgi:hypothetical protein